MMIHIANPHHKSGIPALISRLRYTFGCMWWLMGLLFSTAFLRSCAQQHQSFRAPFAVGRNGPRTCCEPNGGGCVPGAVKYCAEASVSRQWTNLSNPPDKQPRRLTSLSLAKLVLSLRHRKVRFEMIANLSHGFGEFNNNKKWRQSRCIVWSCCVIKNIHVNRGE